MGRFHSVYNPLTKQSDLVAFTAEEEAEADARESLASVVTSAQVNAERDRRIAAGFSFGGKVYDARPEDRENILGAVQMANLAVMAGAQAGNYLWHGGSTPHVWIAQDNSLTTMDAQMVVDFGKAAGVWKMAHIFAARSLKNASPIPANYKDDSWWPQT